MATTSISPNIPHVQFVKMTGVSNEIPVSDTTLPEDSFTMGEARSQSIPKNFEQVLKGVENQVVGLLGDEKAMVQALQDLGPKPDFEDLVAYVMMKMVRSEEQKSEELLRKIENGGHPGLKGFVASKAADFAGVAGAAAGSVLGAMGGGAAGAAAGAAVGQDIAKRALNSATGYASEDSKEMQMQKLSMVMSKKDRMMALLTNTVRTNHESMMRVIGNIRA